MLVACGAPSATFLQCAFNVQSDLHLSPFSLSTKNLFLLNLFRLAESFSNLSLYSARCLRAFSFAVAWIKRIAIHLQIHSDEDKSRSWTHCSLNCTGISLSPRCQPISSRLHLSTVLCRTTNVSPLIPLVYFEFLSLWSSPMSLSLSLCWYETGFIIHDTNVVRSLSVYGPSDMTLVVPLRFR